MTHMELRKIQVTGGSTHVISLPKKWVDRNGLQRSETLAIHEEPDGSLLVVPYQDARPRHRRIVLDIADGSTEPALVRRLVGAYLAGADEIHLRSKGKMDPKVRRTVRTIIRDLVGVEILEEGGDSIVLQDLVGVSDMDLRKTVTRMHRIARIMFDDALAALRDKDLGLADDVISRDDEVDRLQWHVSKQMHALLEQPRLAARLQVRPADALNLLLVSRSIERMADHAVKMCRNVKRLEDPPEALIDAVATQAAVVHAVWDHAFTALKKDDFDQGSAATDEGRAATAWRESFGHTLRAYEPEIVGPFTLIADSIDRVRGYAIDVAEIAMNQALQKMTVVG